MNILLSVLTTVVNAAIEQGVKDVETIIENLTNSLDGFRYLVINALNTVLEKALGEVDKIMHNVIVPVINVADCVGNNTLEELKRIPDNVLNALNNCTSTIMSTVQQTANRAIKEIKALIKVVTDLTGGITQCIGLNMFNCLTNLSQTIKKQILAVPMQVTNIVETVLDGVGKVICNLYGCYTSVLDVLMDAMGSVNNILQCVTDTVGNELAIA